MAVFPHFNGFLGKIERNGARGSIPTAILHRKRYVWVTLLNFYFLPTAPNKILESLVFDAMVESGGGYTPDWSLGVDGYGAVLGFSWLPWPLDEIKSRRDGPRTGNHHFILKKVKFYSVTV